MELYVVLENYNWMDVFCANKASTSTLVLFLDPDLGFLFHFVHSRITFLQSLSTVLKNKIYTGVLHALA